MKKRTISLMLGILAVMMLVGVGFATWVITKSVEVQKQGSINVEEVKEDQLQATVTFVGTDHFAFTANNRTALATDWLTSDSTDRENLSVTIKVVVTNAENEKVDSHIVSTFSITEAAYNSMAGYLVAPAGGTTANGAYTVTLTELNAAPEGQEAIAAGIHYYTVSFAWGDNFKENGTGNALNPLDYFNGGTDDGNDRLAESTTASTNAEAAKEVLNGLFTALNNQQFTFTVKVSAKAN